MPTDRLNSKEVDDIVYEVNCSMITVKAGADVDIGKLHPHLREHECTELDSGANPSAEEGDEALEDGATQVNNIVYSFRLQSTSFDKKSFLTYLKVSRLPLQPVPI